MDLRIIYLQDDYAAMYYNNVLILEGNPHEWTLELILKQLNSESKIVNYTLDMDIYTDVWDYKLPSKFSSLESSLEEKIDFTMDSLKEFSKTQNMVKIFTDGIGWKEV
jgi:hypothetical protein